MTHNMLFNGKTREQVLAEHLKRVADRKLEAQRLKEEQEQVEAAKRIEAERRRAEAEQAAAGQNPHSGSPPSGTAGPSAGTQPGGAGQAGAGQIVIPTPRIVQMKDYFIHPGRFKCGKIEKTGNDYTFYDVELPNGSWKSLTLQNALYPSNTFDDHAQNITQTTAETQQAQIGVTPADINYGLRVLCFLNKEGPYSGVIEEVRQTIWLPDAMTNYPHNATSIDYIANNPAVIIPGSGWPSDHPFGIQYTAHIAGTSSILITAAQAKADPTLATALEGLIGENDPERAKSTLEWSMNVTPAKMWRESLTYTGKRVVVFGVNDYGGAVVGADYYWDGNDRRPARGVRADAKNFHR